MTPRPALFESRFMLARTLYDKLWDSHVVRQEDDGTTLLYTDVRRFGTWAWPTLYLIDKQGDIRFQRIGEGGYTEMEQHIEALLAEPAALTPGAAASP